MLHEKTMKRMAPVFVNVIKLLLIDLFVRGVGLSLFGLDRNRPVLATMKCWTETLFSVSTFQAMSTFEILCFLELRGETLFFIFEKTAKRLKVPNSGFANRPRFLNRNDVVSTPSSTLESPSAWPPRPASTPRGPTWVAGRIPS